VTTPLPTDDVELTILMPCLNEAETLEVCIRKAQGFLERSGVRGEVLISDNGSTDGSQEIATRLGARVTPPGAATARRSSTASRTRAAVTSSWATPTTATTSRTSNRSSSVCVPAPTS
jgi:glycosyltransferase involved in cell wall biosynthesis